MPDFDRSLVDASVTDEEIERAHDAPALPFPDVDEQDDTDDEGDARGLLAPAPNTPKEALANAKRLDDQGTFVGVGMCLRTVRGPEYGVASLWPDAESAWHNSRPRHLDSNPTAIPRGAPVYWVNGRHGHIAISLGGGLCRTTDFHRSGMVDVALISRLASWCSGTLVGWGETLNGIDVWPDPKKPKPRPEPWTWERRVKFLRAEAVRQKRDGHPHRAEQLSGWADKIAARHR